MDDRCVSCGAYIPEGRMVCPSCEAKAIAGFERSWHRKIGDEYQVVEVEEVIKVKDDLHSGGETDSGEQWEQLTLNI